MPNLKCPVCRAENSASPCRRCKADLALLFELESQRDFALAQARSALSQNDGRLALRWSQRAYEIRSEEEAGRLTALACLLVGDFPRAWTLWLRWREREPAS